MAADLKTLTWRKARRSSSNGGACVEIAVLDDRTG